MIWCGEADVICLQLRSATHRRSSQQTSCGQWGWTCRQCMLMLSNGGCWGLDLLAPHHHHHTQQQRTQMHISTHSPAWPEHRCLALAARGPHVCLS